MQTDFKSLRTQLPKGWQETLAKEFDCAKSTIWNALNGKAENKRVEVTKAALRLIKKSKQEKEKVNRKLEREAEKLLTSDENYSPI